jgi:hypothetical protein
VALDTIRERLTTLENQIQSLSDRQDALSLVFRRFEAMPSQTAKLEDQSVAFEGALNTQASDLAAVEKSVSKLTSAWIQVFVPGSAPLEGGIIAFLTKQAGGNVCNRQTVHGFSTSVYDTNSS